MRVAVDPIRVYFLNYIALDRCSPFDRCHCRVIGVFNKKSQPPYEEGV